MASTLAEHRGVAAKAYINEEGGTTLVRTVDGVSPVGGDINLTGGDGITISNPSTNNIQIEVTDTEVVQTINSLNPVAGNINIAGGLGIGVSTGGNTVTVAIDGSSVPVNTQVVTVSSATSTAGAWTVIPNIVQWTVPTTGYYAISIELPFDYELLNATLFQVGFQVYVNSSDDELVTRLTLGDSSTLTGSFSDMITVSGVLLLTAADTVDYRYWFSIGAGTLVSTDILTATINNVLIAPA
ncbi:MAG: hypothetical protein ACPGR8_06435 [Limisphaerales bacterium]